MNTLHQSTIQACGPYGIILLTIVLCSTPNTAFAQTGSMQEPATEQNYQPRPYQGQLEADDGQWIRPGKDYASTRYSTLDYINTKNAKDLKLAFTFSTGMTRGHEAAPCRFLEGSDGRHKWRQQTRPAGGEQIL